jgi:hypothetical protein
MIVRGFEIPSVAFRIAFELLEQLLGISKKTIMRTIDNRTYQTIYISKGYGKGSRRLDIPGIDLRRVQKRLLKSCLYHSGMWSFEDWRVLTGFRIGKSISDNIEPHLDSQAFFQLDFADAFPTVSEDMLRDTLEIIFEESTIRSMFRFKKVRWFRDAFLQKKKDGKAYLPETSDPLDILWAMREIIILLTTFEGRLPQGAPTSPHLFNMTVEAQQVPTIINKCLENFKGKTPFVVTIYADNITISTKDTDISEEARSAVIDAINKETSFKIKSEKTRYWILSRGSKTITGLSIGLRAGKTFITVPQAVQRRARGLLHKAILNKEIRNQALGMIAFLTDVYGANLPRQIGIPHKQLLAAIGRE